ncbi:coadhesin-like [Babylonia areolata]|uniref:coadhesin-like n=1 Tax=Babylonia areolata TaxID=304850 RepID=UPI003FD628E8
MKVQESDQPGADCVAADTTKNDRPLYLTDCSDDLPFLCMVSTVSGMWSRWGTWEDCSATCGQGNRRRRRTCYSPSEDASQTECGGLDSQTESCPSLPACSAKVFEWSPWEEWTACTKTCGGGHKSRSRECVERGVGEADDPQECHGQSSENATCHTPDCVGPVTPQLQWSDWGQWSACSNNCGQGRRSRKRTCVDRSGNAHDFNDCIGDPDHVESCEGPDCPESSWEEWGQWTVCSTTCGVGSRSRNRTCALAGTPNHGAQCRGKGSEKRTCVVGCKSLTKQKVVEQIKAQTSDTEQVELLESWAHSTWRVSENLFNSLQLDHHVMSGHMVATHRLPSRLDCVRECLKVGCRSFNFQLAPDRHGQHECQLNSVNRDEARGDVRREDGYVLYDHTTYVPFLDQLPDL